MSEALADQAVLHAKGVASNVQNSHDIHPTLLGDVYITVSKAQAVEAISILNAELIN